MTTQKHIMSHLITLALALVGAGAGAADWVGNDDGYWGTAANWDKPSDLGEGGYISGDACFLSTKITGYNVRFAGLYNLKYQVKIENGMETPLVFAADGANYGIRSDSTKDSSSYHRLAVGYDADGWLQIMSGSYSFQNAIYVSEKESDSHSAVDGKLEVLGGSLSTDSGLNVGHASGKTGTMIVGGGLVTSATEAFIGSIADATGVLTVTNGSLTAQSSLTIGSGSGANGTLNISQDGVVNVTGGDFMVCKNNADATGSFNISGGTLTIANALKHGFVGSAKNAMGTISGGTVTVGSELNVAHGGNTEASLTISGDASVTANKLYIGKGDGSKGTLAWNGGDINVVSEFHLGGSNSATGVLEVAKADAVFTKDIRTQGFVTYRQTASNVTMQQDFSISYGGGLTTTGLVEVADGSTLTIAKSGTYTGRLRFCYWADAWGQIDITGKGTVIAENGVLFGSATNTGGELILSDGVFQTTGFGHDGNATANTNVKGILTLNGGTLRAGTSNASFIPASTDTGDNANSITCNITANGGTIDTNGKNITIATAITGTGTLTKKGSGTLTLTQTPAFPIRIEGGNVVFPENAELTGKITVAAGAAYVYDPSLTYAGGIAVEEGGLVVWDKTDYTSGTQYDIPSAITFGIGASAAGNLIVNTGARTTEDFSVAGKVTITDLDAETAVTTRWTGADAAANNSWTNANNWTHGFPRNADTAVIWFDSEITGSALQTGENSWTAGMDKLGTLQFENNATLVYVSPDTYRVNPKLVPGAVTGAGTLTLYMAELATDGAALEVPATVSVVSWTENQHAHSGRRNLITGASSARIVFKGLVTSPNGGPHPTQRGAGTDTNDYDFQNAFIAEYVDFDGGLVVDSCQQASNQGEGVAVNLKDTCTIAGNLSGAGAFHVTGTGGTNALVLSGDNEGFTGLVNSGRNLKFASEASGSSKAQWYFRNSDVTFAVETGTLKFGWFNGTGNKKLFKMADGVTPNGLVIEVGKGEIIGKKYFDGGSGLDVTLKKVAFSEVEAGAFTYAGYGFPKIEVAAGEFMFRDDSSDSDAYVQPAPFAVAATVTVDAGGVVSGTNKVSISSLTLADGAFVAAPGTMLTNVGSATLQGTGGVKVLAADTAALAAGETYDLITTTGCITGAPYLYAVDSEGNRISASNGRAKEYWLSKVSSGKLRLFERNPNAGFAIIFK